jgi:hypothetical protein
VCTPLDEYFPVRDIAEPNTMYSPSTFAKEEVILASVRVKAEINVINSFAILFICFPL